MSFVLVLRRQKRDSLFERIVHFPADALIWWRISAELSNVNSSLVRSAEGMVDPEAKMQLSFADGEALITIFGWGDWYTRAPQLHQYLKVFESNGFKAYDPQAEQDWTCGMSVNQIRELIKESDVPPLTSTGKGCKLKPLSDEDWSRME